MSKAAKKVPKKKAANGYKLPDTLPNGEILQDLAKKQWILGPSIGQGGFGEIYSAKEYNSSASKYPYVIKIEPHNNGPLFVEMHFYMRNAKQSDVKIFKEKKGLSTFGMPVYLGSGSHEYKNEKYRFVVMERFGKDIWKLFIDNKRIFPTTTVFQLAVQILDVLEYIHQRGYVHADIKGPNILMGVTKDTENKQVYLVDFGLATKFTCAKDFKPNPKKAHDGTIEYLSRDAHKGVQTRRGDLEVLAYNLIQWLNCTLPWEKNLNDPNLVHKSKEDHMENVSKIINACFGKKSPPAALEEFLEYLLNLEFNSEPNYEKIRKIFISGIEKAGGSLGKPLEFSTTTNRKSSLKRKSSIKLLVLPTKKAKNIKSKKVVNNGDSNPAEGTRKKRVGRPKKNVEDHAESDHENVEVKPKRTAVQRKKAAASVDTAGYTDEMKEVLTKIQNGHIGVRTRQKPQLDKQTNNLDDSMNGYTESMKQIKLKQIAKLANKRPTTKTQNKKPDVCSPSVSVTKEKPVKKRTVNNRKKQTDHD